MSDHTPDITHTPADASAQKVVDQSRRKLAGVAIGASAILTLASRPVLAGVCESPSAAFSGNMSHHGTPITCSGRSPGYWTQHPESWPAPYDAGNSTGQRNQAENWSGGTLFHPIFDWVTNGVAKSFLADFDNNPISAPTSLSMMQVMQMNNGSNPWGLSDPANLGMHIVAALLNAKKGYTPVLSEADVTNMWKEWAGKGYFEPTANVKWFAEDIVKYIVSTFG
ncbi:MAG: hypothetical protein Q8K57_12605 [Thiobacillus sp.]|nr:hypothetical protein [Thiobacillus sp.]MDP3125904.1 hypothetical protein [Thiobacillus sp.]